MSPDFAQGLAALAAVLLLAWGAAALARRTGLARPSSAQRRLSLEATLALDPRRRLLVVRCDGREGLILTGPAGDAWLGWLESAGRGP